MIYSIGQKFCTQRKQPQSHKRHVQNKNAFKLTANIAAGWCVAVGISSTGNPFVVAAYLFGQPTMFIGVKFRS